MARNTERLTQLRRVINDAPEDRLHMRVLTEEATCGTAYCAMGWAIVDPWFRKHGITRSIGNLCGHDSWYSMVANAADYFGIANEEAHWLFASGIESRSGAHSVSKAEVLWNIDELLAGRTTRPYRAVFGSSHARAETVPI